MLKGQETKTRVGQKALATGTHGMTEPIGGDLGMRLQQARTVGGGSRSRDGLAASGGKAVALALEPIYFLFVLHITAANGLIGNQLIFCYTSIDK
jgi:hypothetical protein